MDINNLLTLLENHGQVLPYLVIFILQFFEGPTVIIFAAFAASLGYLNIWIVIILAILSGVIPDTILYLIGKYIRASSLKKIATRFGLNDSRMIWLENKIKKHPVKSIIVIKHVPPLPIPGLILTGFMNMNFKKFFLTQAILNIIGVIVFASIGFYSGLLTNNILKYIKFSELLLPIFIIGIIIIYFLNKYILKHLSKGLAF